LSFQKSRLLSYSGIHLTPFSKTASHIFRLFQVLELDSLFLFLELSRWWLQYFSFKTFADGALLSVWNLQLNLARSVVFLPFAVWSPKPPSSFGLATFFQPT